MNEQTCPHLGVLGPNNEQRAEREYPSFENCCFAAKSTPSHGSLLLADQSTYCLSGGYHQCPRFQSISLHGVAGTQSSISEDYYSNLELGDTIAVPTTSIPLDSEYLTSPVHLPDHTLEDEYANDDNNEDEISPIWLLAGTAFVTVFFLGIGLALFLGWQLISQSAIADAGSTSTVGIVSVEGNPADLVAGNANQDAIYVILTATPDSAAVAQSTLQDSGLSQQDVSLTNDNSGNTAAISDLAVVSEPLPTIQQAVIPATGQNENGQPQSVQPGQVQQNFPAAVTPTPIIVTNADGSASNNAQQQPIANQVLRPEDVSGPDAAGNIPPTPTSTPVPEIDVQVVVPVAPTRRNPPEVLVIPTIAELPTNTPVPTATWPPPIVFFTAVDKELREGKCTTLTWEVQNVRAVYVSDIGVDGKGEKEVCIKDKSKEFDLYVVLSDGSTKIYTTTVQLEAATATPTPTWTYTPLPQPTLTWTPIPPTAAPLPTPTPVLARGAKLDTAQPQASAPISCAPSTTCEIGLLATNTGEGVDNLVIVLAERSQPEWSVLLCRQDGVCSGDRLNLINVGQANTAFITMRLEAPADSAGQNITYGLYAASEASGDTVRSDVLTLNVSIQ